MSGPGTDAAASVPTLVVSDLHLGTRMGSDLLVDPSVLEALLAELEGIERLVLLGDVVELRTSPRAEALAVAHPVLAALGAAVPEVIVVPGNHDHALVAPWLAARLGAGRRLGSECRIAPGEASPLATELAAVMAPARVGLAYPGVWLAPDTWATHGHYLDRHLTLPAFERLGVGLIERFLAGDAARQAGVAGYEAVHGPLYALLDALGQNPPAKPSEPERPGASVRTWHRLARGQRRLAPSTLALRIGVRTAVAALNRAGLGPLSAQLGAVDLRRAVLAAMGTVVERLDGAADHVLFGHSHRAGPLTGDPAEEWVTRGGVRLHNAGSWVHQPHFLTGSGPNPYWPGGALRLEPGRPPELRRPLRDWSRDRLERVAAGRRRAVGAVQVGATPGVKQTA